jgi:hypothetical protein
VRLLAPGDAGAIAFGNTGGKFYRSAEQDQCQ